MRILVLNPLAVLFAAAMGYFGCSIMGWNAHLREMAFAGAIFLVAGEISALPMILTRGASQPAVAQAGLVSTILHMFAAIGMAGAIMLAKAFRLDATFAYWLMVFYAPTLVVVVIAVVQAVKAAPMKTTSTKGLQPQ